MMRDVGARDRNRIVLSNASNKALDRRANAPQPMSTAPAEVGKAKIKEIVDVAVFDDERAIHIGFAEGEIGIQEQLRNDARIHDTDGYRWRAVADVMGAAVGRDNSQCAFADDLPEQTPQQKHACVRSNVFERAAWACFTHATTKRRASLRGNKEGRMVGLDTHSCLAPNEDSL